MSSTGIEGYFARHFANWEIRLPPEVVAERRAGHIFEHGWHIGYIWGCEDGDEYLEFLAQHRMTNDRHLRIYESGRVEHLEVAMPFVVLPKDASPAEHAELMAANAAEHGRISDDLRRRGLLPPVGENLPALDLNEALRSRRVDNIRGKDGKE